MKGVTSTAIFVMFAIGAIAIGCVLVVWRWVDWQGKWVNEATCKAKQNDYCTRLNNGENPDWDQISPKEGCEKFGIVKPSPDECKR